MYNLLNLLILFLFTHKQKFSGSLPILLMWTHFSNLFGLTSKTNVTDF